MVLSRNQDAGRGKRDAGSGTQDAGSGTREAGRRTQEAGEKRRINSRRPSRSDGSSYDGSPQELSRSAF